MAFLPVRPHCANAKILTAPPWITRADHRDAPLYYVDEVDEDYPAGAEIQ